MTSLRNPPGARPVPGPGSHREPSHVSFPALGTTAVLLTADPARADRALAALRAELDAIDAACSRFRPDSELSRANAGAEAPITETTSTTGTAKTTKATKATNYAEPPDTPDPAEPAEPTDPAKTLPAETPTGTVTGSPVRPVPVGPVFAEALEVALRAAALTGGAVDPTVGPAIVALGYDRTFAEVARSGPPPVLKPAAGWRTVGWDPELRLLRLPAGTTLDLGATAKALAADRAARRAASAAGCGVLVNLGGDLATAGPAPRDGWRIAIADDHAAPPKASDPVILVRGGGVATSGTSVRSWQRGGRTRHHIVDPATGDSAPEVWRTVSVAAATCVDANTAATAAMVLGERALDWLRGTGLPARLVRTDGGVVHLGGWPAEAAPDRATGRTRSEEAAGGPGATRAGGARRSARGSTEATGAPSTAAPSTATPSTASATATPGSRPAGGAL